MTKTRKFNGKVFKSQGASKFYRDAKGRAEWHKSKGRKVRVVKCEDGYDVYTRG